MSAINPNKSPRRARGRGTSIASKPPELILPPYEQQLAIPIETLGTSEERPILKGQPTVSSITTQYRGKSARYMTFEIGQAVTLYPNTEYAYPINVNEDGELIHFTVSLNDRSLYLLCILYDADNKPTVIADDNIDSLARKGKGLTTGESIAVDMNGVSLDKGGRTHNVATYISRCKDTFSFGHLQDPYEDLAGTDDDKYYVMEYSPLVPHPYKRIYFTIENRGSEPRLIHEALVKRIAYFDKYESVVEEPELEEQPRTPIIY